MLREREHRSLARAEPHGMDHFGQMALMHRKAFEDFDRMADRMMADFGMPKLGKETRRTF